MQIGAQIELYKDQFERYRYLSEEIFGIDTWMATYKRRRQSFRFRPEHARIIQIGAGKSVHGPDLAFVQLPHDVMLIFIERLLMESI
jgi:hypothetical protein